MENPTRRLCRFEYPCGLCGDEHRSEVYITLNAPNWDDYCDQVEGMTRDPDTLGEIIDRATLAFHQQKGDLERLMRKAKRDGFYKVGHTADVSVIDESGTPATPVARPSRPSTCSGPMFPTEEALGRGDNPQHGNWPASTGHAGVAHTPVAVHPDSPPWFNGSGPAWAIAVIPWCSFATQRQPWGSCAPDGTLGFNWRVVMLEPALVEYIIVHELVHLRAKNHSQDFWRVVAEVIPDVERLLRLREAGKTLLCESATVSG